MRKIGVVLSLLALLSALFVGIVRADPDRTVRAIGDEQFIPNAKVMVTLRWSPGPITVSAGDTVTWVNDTPGEPHTISVVAEADVPGEIGDVFNCVVCGPFIAGHFPAGPPVPVLNAGAPGLDAPGDSLLLAPDGEASAVISAPAGARLHYICAIHPWMIGQITVH